MNFAVLKAASYFDILVFQTDDSVDIHLIFLLSKWKAAIWFSWGRREGEGVQFAASVLDTFKMDLWTADKSIYKGFQRIEQWLDWADLKNLSGH